MLENWKTYRFFELYETSSGLSKARDQFGFGSPFVTFKDVFYNYFLPTELGDLANTNEKEQIRGSIKRGDILLTRTSETLHELGMSSVALQDYPNATFNGFCKRLRLKEKIQVEVDPLFIGYYLRSPNFRNEVSQHATMTTRASLNNTSINSLTVSLPPITDQIQIGKILKAIDDKRELNLQMNKTLEEMAMALYKHWFVDFGPFQGGEFVDSELGMIPKGWEVKGILDLADLLSGGTPKTSISDYWNGNINWVSAKDIGNGGSIYINDTEKSVSELGVKNSSTKILPEDTVILVARGSVGKYGMIAKPMAMNQSCYGLYSKSEFSQGLIYLMFSTLIEQFQQRAYGSVFDTITTSTFNTTKVISPPKELVISLNEKIDPLFLKLKMNILQSETLTTLRDTLLPKLISGEIRVKDAEKTLAAAL
ncbi:hypothetical protein P872_20590 [Rhodonellum psychrophilum GCM71 = DSM 17998]|uniref:Type I restriction modification DNA specificity domain-containing protein n=2 Tax=Rhodonellum TaxID=336827 RepID=U5BUB4_9BACT|nr:MULTISPECIES: restriction endonuclease subunit S [Rhodonellum]ERM81124.1 hypothetical protein P872_20590 [Rhodonellum psychrophilum GCM71 = DSM 17998]SDZ51527.1 type I restriction enzyme, S subunit [Rhodonellum ikkaensis]